MRRMVTSARCTLFSSTTKPGLSAISWLIQVPGYRIGGGSFSPFPPGPPAWGGRFFHVKLTTEQVRNSPDIDTDKPVSRQQETLLHTYYDWPTYWTGGIPLGPHAAAAYPGGLVMTEPYELPQEEQADPHLHSSRDVLGYYIQARDGQIGHVEDFIVDTDAWAIRYMAVDTVNWWPGKKVLVAVTWIEYGDWG